MWRLRQEIYSTEIFRNSLKLLRILPVPSTTLHNGSSAMHTGSPVSSRIRLSRSFSKAPPPASTIPRRKTLQRRPDGAHNGRDALAQRIADHAVVHGDRLGHSLDET